MVIENQTNVPLVGEKIAEKIQILHHLVCDGKWGGKEWNGCFPLEPTKNKSPRMGEEKREDFPHTNPTNSPLFSSSSSLFFFFFFFGLNNLIVGVGEFEP